MASSFQYSAVHQKKFLQGELLLDCITSGRESQIKLETTELKIRHIPNSEDFEDPVGYPNLPICLIYWHELLIHVLNVMLALFYSIFVPTEVLNI